MNLAKSNQSEDQKKLMPLKTFLIKIIISKKRILKKVDGFQFHFQNRLSTLVSGYYKTPGQTTQILI